jgi:hypothetical protein|nr:MAG TPA: hypothetical protein [Caudoviricetes sp.]
MIQKIYKNTDLLFSIEIGDNNNIIDIADIGELTMLFYTDSTPVENHIVVTKNDIINNNQIFIDNTKLDLLNEGLLKYNIKLRFNNTSINEPFDIAKTVETEYFIKNDNFNDGSCTGGTVSDTYSKSEIDLKLSLKANSSDVYSKAETNERLADKANKSDLPDTSILATKDELNLKANKSDVYSKVEVDEKIADAGTIDLSNYYKKAEVDSKLSVKVDVVAGKQLSTNDYTNEDKTKLQSLNNYDDTSIKQLIANKADINNVYSKSEVDAKFDNIEPADLSDYYTKNEVDKKIDDAVTGEIDLSDYYKKNEVDNKLSEKANISDVPDISNLATKTELAGKADISDIPDISAMATKAELSTKANSSDVYSKDELYTKTEVDKKIADIQTGTGTTVDTYTKSQIDTKLASKTDVSRTSALELELSTKADTADVYSKNQTYNRAEIDEKIASAGTTGGTGTVSADVLHWNDTIASEERAELYTKLYNNIFYHTASFVFLDVLEGNKQYIIDISNCLIEGSKNEIKLYGSTISSSATTVSIFNVEIILKKDGSFNINKKTSELYNKAEIDRLLSMKTDIETLANKVAVLESEIKNPSEMTVDCSKF